MPESGLALLLAGRDSLRARIPAQVRVTRFPAPTPFETIQAEEHHRDHAVIEQVFADWNDGPLAHLPSGSFAANAAWLACAAITCNLLRAAGTLASLTYARARGATVRRDLIDVAARTAATAAATSPCTCPKAGTTTRSG